MIYPSVKLGQNWFFYSAVDVHSQPYYFYEASFDEREVQVRLTQGFLGYSWSGEKKAVSFKVGQLTSAFGAFPLRYDDAANPLVDQPPSYGYPLLLRPDQLPCGLSDIKHQTIYKGYVEHYCGGAKEESYGMIPVSLYGTPGAEADFSLGNVDARIQLTNSSPANPQPLFSEKQLYQWTAGAGYTIWQGFRVGFSAFRGPFLEQDVRSFLPEGKGVDDYPATAVGLDVQLARGRWSVQAEWQRFQFNYPAFRTAPAASIGYAEVKAIITPRIYAAVRGSHVEYNRVEDIRGNASGGSYLPNRQSYEFTIGSYLNRWQLLKVSYQWQKADDVSPTNTNVFAVQLITSVHSLSKAIR